MRKVCFLDYVQAGLRSFHQSLRSWLLVEGEMKYVGHSIDAELHKLKQHACQPRLHDYVGQHQRATSA